MERKAEDARDEPVQLVLDFTIAPMPDDEESEGENG